MVGVIDGFRWALLGDNSTIYWPALGLSIVLAIAFAVAGVLYFRRTERTFADII
jgi:lipopolysaccharide transport system permease protein